jgi:N6-L-threonylcarbamoyladenine synthase
MGGRGLRQSEGVFQHVQNLPALLAQLSQSVPDMEIVAVCASDAPRDVEGSYMPVFTVGSGMAASLAALLHVPGFRSSHQAGHIAAARIDSGLPAGPHLALHLSGGTTEVLRCQEDGSVELLGGSDDLHAGQFVDRVGVRLGLPFPAGPELERLSAGAEPKSLVVVTCRGLHCSFSGAEAQVLRMADSGEFSPEQIAAEVYSCLARTIEKLLTNAARETGLRNVLLAGGVASSQRFRALLLDRIRRSGSPVHPYFARPEYAGDNAVGAALLGLQQYKTYTTTREDHA